MHYVPGPPLSEFVAFFWHFCGHEMSASRERGLPTGSVDLILRLDSAKTSNSVMVGPRTRSAIIGPTQKQELLGVHFKTGGAVPFLRCPIDELQDGGMSLADFCGEAEASRVLSVLNDAATVAMKFQIVEQWLLQVADRGLEHNPVVTFAMRAFCSGPYGSSAEVANKSGYSQRRFIEMFKNEVGLTPKHFQRLQRFRKVITAVQHKCVVDWTDLGLSLGYFDQAHLIHDFREFSGVTPAQYLGLRTPFINHVRLPD
jgi:AraC-like DNA-binding protein